jgi:ribonuclease P protein component
MVEAIFAKLSSRTCIIMGIAKRNRLKSRKDISRLMKDGFRYKAYPVHMVVLRSSSGSGEVKCGFSAPKRRFRSAVHRQYVKRVMREVVRPQIGRLKDALDESEDLHVMFIHIGQWPLMYYQVADRISSCINRFLQEESSIESTPS